MFDNFLLDEDSFWYPMSENFPHELVIFPDSCQKNNLEDYNVKNGHNKPENY